MVLTKNRDDLVCTGRVRKTRSTCVTRRVTNVKMSMMSHLRIIIVISYYELINILFLFYLKPNFKDYIFAMSNQMNVFTLTNMVQELLCKIQMSKRHSSKFESSEDHPHGSSQDN